MSDFDAQPAQITNEQINRIEGDFLDLGKRRSRRAALVAQAMSGMELTKVMADDRDAAIAFALAQLSIEDYAAYLREFADMMDSAHTRISVALCIRPDMQEVLAEAEIAAENPGRIDCAASGRRQCSQLTRSPKRKRKAI